MELAMHPTWKDCATRVRVDTMRRGDRFLSYEGEIWTYERVDHALNGVHHVVSDGGKKTCFAGCAEGVLQGGVP